MEGDQNAKRGGITAKVYLEVLKEYLPMILEHDFVLCKTMLIFTSTQGLGLVY